MEEDHSSHALPSDESIEDTTDVEDKKDTTTCPIEMLADSIDTMGLDTQVLESLDVERSYENPQDSVLDENLQDLLYLENRIGKLVEPSPDSIILDERVTWSVQSDLLRAMFHISTQRQLGGALMQYVDALRLRTDLTDSLKKHGLDEEDQNSSTSLEREMSEIIFQDIEFELFSTDCTKVEKERIKTTIKQFYSSASIISSMLWYVMTSPLNYLKWRFIIKEQVNVIAKLAREVQSTCNEREKGEIEKVVGEIVLQTLNVFDQFPERQKIENPVVKMPDGFPPVLLSSMRQQREYPRTSVVGAIGVGGLGAAGAMAGPLVEGTSVVTRPIGAEISTVGAASAVASGRWSWRDPLLKEELEVQLRSAAPRGSYTPVECVATPFSKPVYLQEGGGSSGGGGGADDNDGWREGGGDRGGEGGRMTDRDRNQEYNWRYLDACRSLTEAINDLCRITSQINGIQNDCREMLHKLEVHGMMLQWGLPTSGLSYPECVEELVKLRESIVLLNNDQPMARIEFYRTLRYIISAICKSLDLAAQCGYFLTLLERNQEAARVGVVDVQQLKKTVRVAQFTCYKMLQFSLDQARDEAVQLKEQIEDLLAALTEAGRRSLNMKMRIEAAATNIQQSAADLSITLQLDNRESLSTAIIRLLTSIKNVGVLTEDPEIVPIAANTSHEACERRHDVLNGAKILKEICTILVYNVMAHDNIGDDSTPLTWDTGRDVALQFEELVDAIRKNGRSTGFIDTHTACSCCSTHAFNKSPNLVKHHNL